MISYSKQSIDAKDINQVIKILKSDYLTTGPIVPKFEKKICDITKSKFSVSVNSGTSALHISCMALGLKKMILYGLPQIVLLHLPIVLYIVELKLTLLI